jgi:hypothetical protein
MKLRRGLVASMFAIALIGATPLAAQGNCQPVLDAMGKVFTTPTHIYRTMAPVSKDGGKRTQDMTRSETIYAAGSVFSKVAGSWRGSRIPVEQVKRLEEENIKSSKYTCRFLRDESSNGEAAAIYSLHAEREGVRSDGQMWISKSRGLPLRHEFDLDAGAGSDKGHPDIQHHSVRYEYANVQPPLP